MSGGCLKRQFNGNPPDADQIAIALREPTHEKFDLMLRVNLHEGMHCFISKWQIFTELCQTLDVT